MQKWLFVGCAVMLSACSGVASRQDTAMSIASPAGMKAFTLPAGQFRLAGFYKTRGQSNAATVYIEGDGLAWIDRYTVSDNPTPENPVALKLASQDSAAKVVYLARPCQFVNLDHERSCSDRYWTSRRFAPEVITSYERALDSLKSKLKVSKFHVVGFSGGGAVAALLTARRSDVASLRTVAGNLDHVALNRSRRVSPLTGSLDPMKIAKSISSIPQVHYSGASDRVVLPWVSQSFVKRAGNAACVKRKVVQGAEHTSGWARVWPSYAAQIPSCK